MIEKRQPYVNKKLREASRGQPCTLQGPNCTGGGEDTVFCHLNESYAGKGMGQKADDFAGFDGCQACHRDYDTSRLPDQDFYILRAVIRTLRRRFDEGLIK